MFGKKTYKCMYCGKSLKEYETNNCNDYGLHNIPDESVCCSKCDTITITNRLFKRMIDNPLYTEEGINHIINALNVFKNTK